MLHHVPEQDRRVTVEELCQRFNTSLEKGLTSEQAAEGLAKHGPNRISSGAATPRPAVVRRNGGRWTVTADQLTLGDVVEIQAGDKVPADVRIVQAEGDLRVDNSAFSGESEPKARGPGPMTDENPLETENLLLWTTVVTQGKCAGIVFAVGEKTIMRT